MSINIPRKLKANESRATYLKLNGDTQVGNEILKMLAEQSVEKPVDKVNVMEIKEAVKEVLQNDLKESADEVTFKPKYNKKRVEKKKELDLSQDLFVIEPDTTSKDTASKEVDDVNEDDEEEVKRKHLAEKQKKYRPEKYLRLRKRTIVNKLTEIYTTMTTNEKKAFKEELMKIPF